MHTEGGNGGGIPNSHAGSARTTCANLNNRTLALLRDAGYSSPGYLCISSYFSAFKRRGSHKGSGKNVDLGLGGVSVGSVLTIIWKHGRCHKLCTYIFIDISVIDYLHFPENQNECMFTIYRISGHAWTF